MGGRADGLAVGRSLALDGFPLAASPPTAKLDRAVVLLLGARRDSGARRRAGRPARPRDRASAATVAERIARVLAGSAASADEWPLARPASARFVRRRRCCSDFLADRGRPSRRARATLAVARRAAAPGPDLRSGGGDASLSRAASSSAIPRPARPGWPSAPRRCAPTIMARLAAHRDAIREHLPRGSAGLRSSITPTARPARRCSCSTPADRLCGSDRARRSAHRGRPHDRLASLSSRPGCSPRWRRCR